MTGVDVLLDTNAVIAWIENDWSLIRMLAQYRTPGLALFTLAELDFGARNSSRVSSNLEKLEGVLRDFRLVLPRAESARVYGQLRLALKARGRPVPANDLWIASVATDLGLPLVTRDAHFDAFATLRTLAW